MSISNAKDNLRAFNGDGITTGFPVSFTFRQPGDLKVYRRTTNSSILLTLTTDYSVSGDALAGSGQVNMVTAPQAGARLVVSRDVPARQAIELSTLEAFPSGEVEKTLDDLARQIGDVQRRTDRAILADVESEGIELPQATERAGRLIGFDDAGALELPARDAFKGDPGRIDFSGPLALRGAHDATAGGTTYLATDQVPALLFIRETASFGVWSPGIPYGRGEIGEVMSRNFANATTPLPANLVDPSIVSSGFIFGAPFHWPFETPPDARCLLLDGRTIGKPGSGAAHTGEDLRDAFALCRATPGLGNSGAENFDAFETVKLPDYSDRAPYGVADMGGIANALLQRKTTLTTTSGSAAASAASVSGLAVGMSVIAPGVSGGTTIAAIGTPNPLSVTLSAAASASGVNVAARFSLFSDPERPGTRGGQASLIQLPAQMPLHAHAQKGTFTSSNHAGHTHGAGSYEAASHSHGLGRIENFGPGSTAAVTGSGSTTQTSSTGPLDVSGTSQSSGSHDHTTAISGDTDPAGLGQPMPALSPGITGFWYAWLRRISIAAPTAFGVDGRFFAFDASEAFADPGPGTLRLNDLIATATALYIDDADGNGHLIGSYLRSAREGDRLELIGIGDPGTFAYFKVAGAPVNHTGWSELPLETPPLAFTGSFSAAKSLSVNIVPKGDAGTIAINSVVTLLPNEPAYVTNIGNERAAVLDIGIPRGADGAGAVSTVNSVAPVGGNVALPASTIPVTPTGALAATNAQAALAELDGDLSTLASTAADADAAIDAKNRTLEWIVTASGNWTKPAGLKKLKVEAFGGGGAGGGCAASASTPTSANGAGGGAGEYAVQTYLAADILATEPVTIGAGGTPASNATGGAGGATSFGAHLTANGGGGGGASAATTGAIPGPNGGVGGTGGTGTAALRMTGNPGASGMRTSTAAVGGNGGGGFFGGGGDGAYHASSGGTAGAAAVANSGAGGGGAANTGAGGASAKSGGAGGSGLIRLTGYF